MRYSSLAFRLGYFWWQWIGWWRGHTPAADGSRYMGDSKDGIIAGSGRKPVRNDLHLKKIEDCGTIGGDAANF